MNLLLGIVIANVALALLAAVLIWRASLHRDDLESALCVSKTLAETDALTDLPNRHGLQQRLQQTINAADKEPALIVIDLDGFKVINDTLGHAVGDSLLKAAADRFRSCLKDSDTLARLGGDEFAALIAEPDAEDCAASTALALAESLKEPFLVEGDVIHVKASIGIATAEQKDVPASEVMRRADVAMYVAKGEKHQTFQIYTPGMDESLQIRRTISAELDRALTSNELQLVYQPLVCARTGKVMSAEALMRWPGKEGMAGSPGVFIPIAEETGLITKLGEWALDQAIIEIKRQQTIPIAVNVSPVQFRVEGFADSIEAAISRHGISPHLLRIEITEGVLISHTGEAQRTMRRLREMGVQVLLDDFGTGYSSLSYLQQFEFDGLKIDRAFIQHLEDGRTGRQLLKSIIALGHSLNMKVIAEGVETQDQASILQLLSCDFLQGYALGRPDLADKLQGERGPDGMPTTPHRKESWQRALNS